MCNTQPLAEAGGFLYSDAFTASFFSIYVYFSTIAQRGIKANPFGNQKVVLS